MTATIVVAFVALVVMFALATVFELNIGLIAFAAAFVVGVLVGDLDPDGLLALFPADMFVLLAGVTYLFGVARANGTVEWMTNSAFRLTGGRIALVPWVFFLLSFAITALGALPGATVAIVAPLAMSFAAAYRINPLLMGLLVTHGCHAGSLAPVSPIGIIVNGAIRRAGLPDVSMTVFLNQMLFATGVCVVAYILFGGPSLVARSRGGAERVERTPTDADSGGSEQAPSLNTYRIVTLLGLLVFVVLALGFKLDVGFTAFMIGLALTLYSPRIADSAIKLTAWPSILLITGVLTFIGVMEEVGAIDVVSDLIQGVDNPMLTTLVVAVIGAVTSLFSTTAGVLGATVPLAVPSLHGAGGVNVAGAISCITISSSLVDTSPASGLGALLIASLRNRDPSVYFKQLLFWGIAMAVTGPLLSWLLFVVIGVP